MVTGKYRFGLALALVFAFQLAALGAFFLIPLLDMEDAQRMLLRQALAQRAVLLGALALLLLFALGMALHALFNAYAAPLSRLAEDAALLAANPGHRATACGAAEVRDLAKNFNLLADAYQALHDDVQEKIENANRTLAEERNRLAALMSELTLSVLVCNIEGRILLYNNQARQLLETGHCGGAGNAIGLGRSLFGTIDRALIVHALEQIQYQLRREQDGSTRPGAGFVATLAQGRVVRAHMTPVLGGAQAIDGFVLTLEDITRKSEADSRRDALLSALTQDTRAALGNIRAAVEAMQTFPAMNDAKRAQFAAVIDEESQRLARQIDDAVGQYGEYQEGRWQLEDMRGADLVALLQRRISAPSLRTVADDAIDATLWLSVDSYVLTEALAWISQRLCAELGVSELRVGLQRSGRLARLGIGWTGAPLSTDTLRTWENAPLPIGAAGSEFTLASVVALHGGAAMYRAEPSSGVSHYRLLLPIADPQAALDIPQTQQARPEFYDFDLFHRPGQTAELDQALLADLSYTVFDTETTGLQPAAGDEIISIGAVRIVNRRLLQQESFDQLVKPQRMPDSGSIAIHGIVPAMLISQPPIAQVLPQFHRFAGDSVLVAHNAAFDMRFLEMQEARTGVRFTQPVLDTLLLSQVIHPHQAQHTLEAIAVRLGVAVIGRHTALGDAILTAEVFLKMIPLLADKRVLTLRDALDAAQKTLYARIRY